MAENDFQDGVRQPSWICEILILGRVTILGIKIRIGVPNFVVIE